MLVYTPNISNDMTLSTALKVLAKLWNDLLSFDM